MKKRKQLPIILTVCLLLISLVACTAPGNTPTEPNIRPTETPTDPTEPPKEDPAYITYTVDNTPRNYIAIDLTLGYRRTARQMDAIVHATSISALPDLLNAAVQNHAAELTVQMNYFENQQAEVLGIVQQVQRAQQGETADPWQVNFYPEGANVGIIEIILKK